MNEKSTADILIAKGKSLNLLQRYELRISLGGKIVCTVMYFYIFIY